MHAIGSTTPLKTIVPHTSKRRLREGAVIASRQAQFPVSLRHVRVEARGQLRKGDLREIAADRAAGLQEVHMVALLRQEAVEEAHFECAVQCHVATHR